MNKHNTKQAHMQGAATMGSVYWFQNVMKQKTILTRAKYQDKNHWKKQYKMHNYTPRLSDIGPYEVCNLCT